MKKNTVDGLILSIINALLEDSITGDIEIHDVYSSLNYNACNEFTINDILSVCDRCMGLFFDPENKLVCAC